jgi:uncharacterized membrane protein YdjX (TVP38/TMEM64 family)
LFRHFVVAQTQFSDKTVCGPKQGADAVKNCDPTSQDSSGVAAAAVHKRELRKNLLKALLLAVFLVTALAVVRFSPLGAYLKISNTEVLQARLREFSNLAPAVFLLAGAFMIMIGTPRSVISILGGIVFGLFWGILLALLAAMLGSTIIFLLTKWLGRPLFKQKVGGYLKVIENHTRADGFLLVLIMRQLPLTSLLINVLLGLTSISLGIFLLGSIVGLLPETIIFALFGSSLQESFALRVSIASSLWVLLIVVVRLFFRRSPLAQSIALKLKAVKSGSG